MPNFTCISTTPVFIASDINECEENTDGCAQTCTDTESGYICSCRSGYRLASDRHGCVGMYNLNSLDSGIAWILFKEQIQR